MPAGFTKPYVAGPLPAERILPCTQKPAMSTSNRIEINPEIMLGKPVVRGTRITVELLLRKLSEGATEDDLLDAHPHLTRDDIKAAIAYAADTVAREQRPPLKSPT